MKYKLGEPDIVWLSAYNYTLILFAERMGEFMEYSAASSIK